MNDHLRALELKGYIERSGMAARGIRLLRAAQEVAPLPPSEAVEKSRQLAAVIAERAAWPDARKTWVKRPALPTIDGPIVYFVQSSFGGPIKIGTTIDLLNRFDQLQSCSPLPLVVVSIQRGDASCEAKLHNQFKALRLHGEWFLPGDELVTYLRGCIRLAEPIQ